MHHPTSHPPALRWVVLAGVWLLYCGFGLVAASLAPLVLRIEADLGFSHSAMGSIMGAWQLVYIAAAIPCGILLDRIAGRYSLLLGALLIAASALGRSVATDYWSLLGAVMLFGLGGPIISAGAPKVITAWFQGKDRGLAMGIYMTGPALGGVVALTLTHSMLLPWLQDSWRSLFQLWAACAAGSGLIWFVIASQSGVLAQEAQSRQSNEQTDQRGGNSVMPLLKQPAVRLVMGMSVCVFLYNHGLNNWLPELLRVGGMDLVTAGYWAALPTLVGIIGSLTIPRLATPERRFNILMLLCGIAAVACLLLQLSEQPWLASGLILQGIARSAMMTVLILALVELPGIGERYAGTASGLFFAAAEVGGMLGPLSLGIAYDLTGGFDGGLWLLTLLAVVLILATMRLQRLANA